MRLIHRKAFAVVYWMVAFAATILAIVFGAKAGAGGAPKFSDGSGTSVGSQILFGIGGALLAGLAVAALFAGIWMGLWAADRRANPEMDDRDQYDSLDDLDDDFDEAERQHDEDSAAAQHERDRIRGQNDVGDESRTVVRR